MDFEPFIKFEFNKVWTSPKFKDWSVTSTISSQICNIQEEVIIQDSKFAIHTYVIMQLYCMCVI